MKLDKHVIDMFTELTKPADNVKMEKTCYGTISVVDGTRYVKLDGSDLLIPAASTVKTSNGDRVTVLMRNHSVTVTGNLTAPSSGDGGSGTGGMAATIEVGTVTTGEAGSSASVTNSGTASQAVFDFVIPKGDKGDKGEKGEKGDTGTWDGTIPEHSHDVSDITDFPKSLPADGGNADTANTSKYQQSLVLPTATDILSWASSNECPFNCITEVRVYNCPTCPTNYGYSSENNDFIYTIYKIENNTWLRIKAHDIRGNYEYHISCTNGTWSEWARINDYGNAETLDGFRANEIASNPNLLTNPDFRINQRGLTEYASGYTVDRWSLDSNKASVSVGTDGVRITAANDITSNTHIFWQWLEFPLPPGKYTLSVNVKGDVTGLWNARIRTVTADGTFASSYYTPILCTGVNKVSVDLPENEYISAVSVGVNKGTETGNSIKLEWIKLEPGPVATRFCPPDPATELAKCQRYYYKTNACISYFIPTGLPYIPVNIRFPVTMRMAPTLTMFFYDANGTRQEGQIANYMTGNAVCAAEFHGVFDDGIQYVKRPDNKNFSAGTYSFNYEASAELRL